MMANYFNVSCRDGLPGRYTIDPLQRWTTALPPPFVILIHGYNNTKAEAERSYRRIVGSPHFRDCTLIGFHWPATRLYLRSKRKMEVMRVSLKAFLLNNFTRDECLNTTIVGHSMGCRLALRCLTDIAKDSRARVLPIQHLILWAAAVDEDEISKGKEYYRATGMVKNVWVMRSEHDTVLRDWFPKGDFARALGYGGPVGAVRPNVRTIDCTSFVSSHSAYWNSATVHEKTKNIIRGTA
ncbi:MAG: alpha/beta hydrolase [Planctomycetota bacterium]